MVQRYEFEIYHCNGGEVVASDNGEYVSYEDYAALRKIASMLMEKLSDDAEIPSETVELMMDLGVFDD